MKLTIELSNQAETDLRSWMLGYLDAKIPGGAPEEMRERIVEIVAAHEAQAVIEA